MSFWKKENSEPKTLGQLGEDLAEAYLKSKGYKILERNFANTKGRRLGEIDIVAQKEKEIIFVEVKTREMNKWDDALPEDNITRQKLHKLSKIAVFYIRQKDLWGVSYRFDAVSVWIDQVSGQSKIKHLESIFF